ncbi:MAG TPA: stage II sporulation protein M [Solirubrobacteraceae bacterium]
MTRVKDLALVQGMADTRATLVRWNLEPWPVVRAWLWRSLAIAVGLLVAVLVIARFSTPDSTPMFLPGLNMRTSMDAVWEVLFRNSLVLALHAFACVAGFIAGSSLPREAQRHSGIWARIHDRAGPLAIAFVIAATTFSLMTQAFVLGNAAATIANQGGMAPALLLVGILPHALPELVALFLPLAAWVLASRRGDWHELLAATFATTALAAPVLVVAAFVEVYVSPHLILFLRG